MKSSLFHTIAELGGDVAFAIALPARQITSCAFGGPDLRTLYVTSAATGLDEAARAEQPLAGALFAVELDSPGRPAHRFGRGAP